MEVSRWHCRSLCHAVCSAVYGFDSNNVKNVTVGGSETFVVISNLLPVATYKVRVAVINSRGISIFSPSESFTTQCE